MATREEAIQLATVYRAAGEVEDAADGVVSLLNAAKLASALLALDEENEYLRAKAVEVLDDNDLVRAHNEKLRQLMLAVQRFDTAGLKLWVCRHCMASGSLTEEDGDGAAAMHDRTCIKNPLVQERNALAREVEGKQTAIDALKLALDGLSAKYNALATGKGSE